MFGRKRDAVTGYWKLLRNDDLNDLHCLMNFSA